MSSRAQSRLFVEMQLACEGGDGIAEVTALRRSGNFVQPV